MPLVLLLLLADPTVSPLVHERTKALAEQATANYGAERFAEALTHFSEAYQNEPLPSLLFNIAQCHRALREWRQAAEFYQRFLDALPTAPNAPRVRALLAEAEERAGISSLPPLVHPTIPPTRVAPGPATASAPLAPARPTHAPPLSPPSPNGPLMMDIFEPVEEPPPPHTGAPAGAIALMIAGGAVLAAGVAFGAINLAINGQNQRTPNPNPTLPGTDTITYSQAQLEDVAGTVAVPANAVGGAALAGGLAWWLLAK